MHPMAGRQPQDQEPSELLVDSVKEQNKRGAALFGFIFASCWFGDFGVWEEKLAKSAVSPQSHHVCLEKAHVLREKAQYQA